MKQKRRAHESPSTSKPKDPNEGAKSQYSEVEGEEANQPGQTPRREWRIPLSNSNDFRIELPEFEGKLDLDEFLDCLLYTSDAADE